VLAEEPICPCRREPSTIVDHIRPKSQGGTDERSNLRGIGARCHAEKTAREGLTAQGLRR
jgi:5-methylcytosine-specific restriction protein A